LTKAQTNQLLGLLKVEGQKALGREMIFEVCVTERVSKQR
jgi:hypothetical protein